MTTTPSMMRVRAEINLDAVYGNFQRVRERIRNNTKICAVVKADAYGHGARQVAETIRQMEEIWGFAVATVEEAVDLRLAGMDKPVLILGFTFRGDYETLLEYNIRPTLFDTESAKELSALAKKRGTVLPVHIKTDTGMSRIGLADNEEGAAQVQEMAALEGLLIEGVFTHFARADEKDKENVRTAFLRFDRFTKMLSERGLQIPIRHCCNSAGLMELPEAHLDMVRSGIINYGIYPSDEMDREAFPLAPAMRLVSHVSHVKEIPAGTPVSYGGTFVAPEAMRIATIPVGYADGYPRSLSNKGHVLIHGKKAPILGRVCMDQFMVDVTGTSVQPYDEAVLMGKQGEEEITVDTLGALSGRFPYEFVCDIGKRVPRVYDNGAPFRKEANSLPSGS